MPVRWDRTFTECRNVQRFYLEHAVMEEANRNNSYFEYFNSSNSIIFYTQMCNQHTNIPSKQWFYLRNIS